MTGVFRARWRRHAPHLEPSNWRPPVSAVTPSYNCLAFAAGDTARWWDPLEQPGLYWPPGVARGDTVGDWAKALATVGFSVNPEGSPLLEPQVVQVALFANQGKASHAARQLKDGWWASKMGGIEDIEHRLPADLERGTYGQVTLWLKRPRLPHDP